MESLRRPHYDWPSERFQTARAPNWLQQHQLQPYTRRIVVRSCAVLRHSCSACARCVWYRPAGRSRAGIPAAPPGLHAASLAQKAARVSCYARGRRLHTRALPPSPSLSRASGRADPHVTLDTRSARSTARHAQLDEARYATRSRGQTLVTASEGARWLNARAADRDERRSARALGTIERDAGTRALLEEEPRA